MLPMNWGTWSYIGIFVACQSRGQLFKTIENQAHRFASAFLLPAESFREDLGAMTLDRCVALKSKWCVSVQAMLKRAGQIGVVSEEQEKRCG